MYTGWNLRRIGLVIGIQGRKSLKRFERILRMVASVITVVPRTKSSNKEFKWLPTQILAKKKRALSSQRQIKLSGWLRCANQEIKLFGAIGNIGVTMAAYRTLVCYH